MRPAATTNTRADALHAERERRRTTTRDGKSEHSELQSTVHCRDQGTEAAYAHIIQRAKGRVSSARLACFSLSLSGSAWRKRVPTFPRLSPSVRPGACCFVSTRSSCAHNRRVLLDWASSLRVPTSYPQKYLLLPSFGCCALYQRVSSLGFGFAFVVRR